MYRSWIILCLYLCSASLGWGDEPVGGSAPKPVAAPPVIDLQRLEPQVAEQLRSVQTLLIELTSKPGTTDKQRADAYGEFGRLLHAYGYAEEAVVCYRQATVGQPDEPRWWHLWGCAAESAGTLDDAERVFRQARKLKGDNRATGIRLANVLRQINRREEAKRLFGEVLKLDEKQAAAHAGLGNVALEERDYQSAITHLNRAVELAPGATRLHYSLAMAYRGAGDLDRARSHLRLRGDIGLKPDDPWFDELSQLLRGVNVHLNRGKIALAAGAVKDAVAEYRLAVAADDDNVTAHTNLAVALVRLQQFDEAIEQLEEALRIDPRNKSVLYNLASLRANRGDLVRAAILFSRLLKIDPQDLDAHRQLAQVRVSLNQPDEAIEILNTALSLAPSDEATILQLAAVLSSQQQYEEAGKLLIDAHRRFPDRGLTAHALARHWASCPDAKLRNGRQAVPLAQSVYDAQPTVEHGETLALALAAADRFDEAIRLQKQLIVAAKKQWAGKLIERLQANLDRFEQHQPGR